jgi:hypothetical protein
MKNYFKLIKRNDTSNNEEIIKLEDDRPQDDEHDQFVPLRTE